MARNTSASSGRYIVIGIGLLVGIGFYTADVIIDVFIFRSGTFSEELLDPTYHEIWMRTAVLLVAVAFSIYVHILLRREQHATEHAMRSEKFLNSVVDNIPSMVFIKDAKELRFVRVNRAGEQLLGLTTQELEGNNDYDFFPESQADYFTHTDREALDSGAELSIPEEQIDTVTLGKRWLRTTKVPILDDKGQPIYLLGISEDITQAKLAEFEQRQTEIRLQTIFDTAAEFIFVVNSEDRITLANNYVFERTGYTSNDIIGHSIKEFLTPDSQQYCECDFSILKERRHCRSDIEFVCKDGSILQLECSSTALPDENGKIQSFIIIQRDVTERKLAEEESKNHQQKLAHVARLGTMGEMATGIAHELNQPLTALVSYCGVAESLVNSLPSPPQNLCEILELAMEQAHRAGEIIRNLREFVSKGSDASETFELDQAIRDIINLLRPDLQKGGVKVELHSDGLAHKVTANKVQIEQVLVNLVRNSLDAFERAATVAGQIDIQTSLLPNGMIEVIVTDNGPGIDEVMKGKIFDQFQTIKAAGMGIGLPLSRSIIESHGGKLWAEENHQNGALFGFELPVSE